MTSIGTLQERLAAALAQQHQLLQQRARLAELLEQAVTHLNVLQGRIAELTELIALADTVESSNG